MWCEQVLLTKANPSRGGGATPRDLTLEGDGQPGCLEGPIGDRRSGAKRQDTGSSCPLPSPKGKQPMLATIRKRYEREDEGFTLIELMVVVLIIAILLAIAIPTFLGARDRANNRAAQSSLRNALTAAKTLYTDAQDFTAADTSTELETVEPSLEYVTADSTNYKKFSIAASGAHQWGGAALSKTNTCFWIREVAVASGTTSAGTYFGSGADTDCTGTDALGATGSSFP